MDITWWIPVNLSKLEKSASVPKQILVTIWWSILGKYFLQFFMHFTRNLLTDNEQINSRFKMLTRKTSGKKTTSWTHDLQTTILQVTTQLWKNCKRKAGPATENKLTVFPLTSTPWVPAKSFTISTLPCFAAQWSALFKKINVQENKRPRCYFWGIPDTL